MFARWYPFRTARGSSFCNILSISFVLAVLFGAPRAGGQTWTALGPEGGDARALASDPDRPNVVYLGSTDGHVFGSNDGGRHWAPLGLVGTSHNAIVTTILVAPRDSKTLFASIWTREPQGEGGGVYRSLDGGKSWRAAGLAGHAVRALVMAPSDPNTLVAGALDGVFRSCDAGRNWEMITPADDPELRNFDSLAIDPQNSDVIYAGTFHLPWKTIDGGRDWVAVHDGMIDDSDVLSLAVNPSNPEEVFASACSGIYRSTDAGMRWKRIPGIPNSSRRTLVIRFDPAEPRTMYAGTTEGLWKSVEGGLRWRRVSPADWVVNSLVVLPLSDNPAEPRVVIGTERQGVLLSSGRTDKFEPANEGFQHRRVVSLTLDRENPERLGVVLANASEPVLVTENAGETWSALGSSLAPKTVRRLFSTPDGWRAAPASGGLMKLDAKSGKWVSTGGISDASTKSAPAPFRVVVNDLCFSDHEWLAATEEGLFKSSDEGSSWSLLPFSSITLPVNSVRVSSDGSRIRIVSSHGMIFSEDAGRSWKWHDLPFESYGALRLDIADETTLLATSPTGLYISRDAGAAWTKAQAGLPAAAISDLLVRSDAWVVSMEKGGLYVSRDRGASWSRIEGPAGDSGRFPTLEAGFVADHVYAGSANEGLYLLDLSSPSVLATRVNPSH
jgi:photosystem II stability/assembly factor-like uncharacterized protein